VLLVLPTNLGFERQTEFLEQVSNELNAPESVELFSETIDLPKLKEPGYSQELEKIYRAKYKDERLDAIVAGQRPALAFVLEIRSRLFPGVPVIFTMIPKDIPDAIRPPPGVTGTEPVLDYRKTAELAMALQPGTTRLVVLCGTSPRDKWLEWIAKKQMEPLSGRLQFTYWEGLSPAEVRERYKELSSTDVLFFLSETEDREGHVYSQDQYLDRIVADAPRPMYAGAAQLLGHGIVGGNLYDSSREAKVVAEQVKQILGGKRAEEVAIRAVPMSSIVDWRLLARWQIPVSRVPETSEMRFEEPSVWAKYKFVIVSIVVFIALETILICWLLIEVQRKNAARRLVERRFETERVVAEFSERLAHCAPEDVERAIQEGLEAIRNAKGADWVLWVTLEAGTVGIARTFGSTDKSISSNYGLQLGDHTPWLMEQIQCGQTVALSNLEQMPKGNREDHEYLESRGVGSILVIASNANADAGTALVLARRECGQEWTRAVVSRLKTLSNIFGTALHKHRAEVELKEKNEWLEMILQASRTALWELDVVAGKVRWSQRDDSLMGKTPVELELSWEKFLERVPEEDRGDLYRRTLAALEDRTDSDNLLTEWRYHEAGGSERWVLFRGRVYRDGRGRPLRLRGVNVDITELKRAKTELLELTERLIQAQESERQRLARELHDDIGQRLSLLIIGLDRLKHGLPIGLRVAREELTSVVDDASQLAADVHGLSHQLHSSKLKHLGLNSALRELCAQVSRQHDVNINLEAEPIPGFVSEERALCLYRVAQEALNNAVKHSGSRSIEVLLAPTVNMLRLTIRDHGTGFNVSQCPAGVGLASMRERVRMAAGKLYVSSKAGEGTEIVTEVGMERVARHANAD